MGFPSFPYTHRSSKRSIKTDLNRSVKLLQIIHISSRIKDNKVGYQAAGDLRSWSGAELSTNPVFVCSVFTDCITPAPQHQHRSSCQRTLVNFRVS